MRKRATRLIAWVVATLMLATSLPTNLFGGSSRAEAVVDYSNPVQLPWNTAEPEKKPSVAYIMGDTALGMVTYSAVKGTYIPQGTVPTVENETPSEAALAAADAYGQEQGMTGRVVLQFRLGSSDDTWVPDGALRAVISLNQIQNLNQNETLTLVRLTDEGEAVSMSARMMRGGNELYGINFNTDAFGSYALLGAYEAVKESLTVTFWGPEGELVEAWNVPAGTLLGDLPEAPVREGYTFVGWFAEDGSIAEKETPVGSDLSFHASYEQDYPATVADARTEKLSVHVEVPEGALPADARFQMTEVNPEDYRNAVEKALENGTTGEILAVDMKFIAPDGTEYQPLKPVTVNMTVVGMEKAEHLSVVHIADDGEAEVIYFGESETVKMRGAEDQKVISFPADGFSVYAVVETILETTIQIDGQTYKVTAVYDDRAGIPSDAKLSVSEMEVLNEEYVRRLNETAEALGVSAGELGYLRMLDISIVGEDGTAYKPNDQVKITVELMDETETGDLRVVHFGAETEEISASTEGDTVTFTTDSFSLFSFVDLSLIQNVVDAVFGSTYTEKIYENDDIIVSGRMPRTAIVEVKPATVEIEGENILVAYDIKIYAGLITRALGLAWQPTDGALSVQVKSDVLENGKILSVYHMADENAEPEYVTSVNVSDSSVVFDASSFSIYPIGEDLVGGNARVGYRFWYYNGATNRYEEINTQYFRYRDVQDDGSAIYEPSIPGISQSDFVQIFEGWHKGTVSGDTAELEDETVTIATLNQELQARTETEYVEGTIVNVIAKLKPAYYITYVDVNSSSVLSTDLVLKNPEGTTYFQVKDAIKPTRYENKLTGWVLLDELTEPNPTVYQPGYSYEISSNITLAPLVEGGYWLVFDDNDLVDDGTGRMVSGGASYTSPAFYMNSSEEQQPTVQPEDPTWTGYAFGGWYEDEACTTPFEFGGLLTRNTTVHAKWIPSDSSYRVIVWKQKTTDSVNAADADKTYDYDFSDVIETGVKTGNLVYLNDSYTKIYGENGTSTDTDKQYFTYNSEKSDAYIVVKADGSSVMNVYYDRKPMTINFYTWGRGYTYTPTTAESGTQYGIYNDEYVELTHVDGDDIYSYTYSPVYTATTGNTGTQYGIIDGEYNELDREAVYEYVYRPFNVTTAATGTQYALIDGEYVQLARNVVYYPAAGYSYTQSTNDNDNSPQKYGIYNGNIVPVYYGSDWRGRNGWYRTEGWLYYSDSYSGSRFIRGSASASNTQYTGTVYYVGTGNTQNFSTTVSGTPYGRSGNNNNYTYFPLREEAYWTYTRNGQTITYTGTRFTQSGNNSDYTGTRYSRSGGNWWDYSYTQTDADSNGLYGLDERGGHVSLTRATSGSYLYSYNGNLYTGTRYIANNNPATYTGQRYTLEDGNYDTTETNGGGLYGRDANHVYRPLTATVTKAKVWAYVDNEGEVHYYTGTRYTRSANQQNSWQLYKQFQGLYGSTLESNGYTWPMEYNWYETGYGRGGNANTNTNYNSATTGGSRMTIKTTFEPVGGDLNVNYYGNTASTSGASIRFHKQRLDGSGYDLADTIYVGNNSGSFHINDKYTGFHAAYYSTNGGSTRTAVTPKGSDGYYGNAISYGSNGMDIYFDRINYKLSFFTNNAGNDVVEYSIPYETNISGYSTQNPGQRTGHYFIGWYADAAFTQPFDFNITMPDHNVDVYGYWRMERIRIVIVPGAGNAYLGSQALRFRLDYDETIGGSLLESATRVGYVLDGWYTDPEFTNKWIFSNPVNSSVEGVDMTYQTAAKWASARVTYGDDDEANSNVRGILQLFAKWIPDASEKGVNVIYDPGEAGLYDTNGTPITTVPVDQRLYQEGSDVVVGPAPSGYSDLYIFDYWEAVDSNGNVLTVTDGRGNPTTTLYPGLSFNVSGVEPYSTLEVEGETIIKTIKLRAHYTRSDVAEARFTTITYDGDNFDDPQYPTGSTNRQGRASDGSEQTTVTLDKQINTEIILPNENDFYLDGFTLVGWSFFEGSYEDQVAALAAYNADPDNANNQLINFLPNQKVAADNLDQGLVNDHENTLYAMWQPKTYSITVKQVVEAGVPVQRYSYPYMLGVENQLLSNALESGTKTLTGNTSVTWQDAVEYYGRVGHVFQITTPTIAETEEYAVRVSATVLRDDGTRETIEPNELGNYEILGDIEITYTYSLKVPVKLEKRALNNNALLTGSSFLLTPVTWNAETQRWDTVGSTTFAYDMTSISSLTRRLQEGVYRVTETQAPADYAMMGEPVLLTVRKDEVFLLRTTTGNAVNENVAKLTGNDSHTLTIYDRPIQTVTIKKTVVGSDTETAGYTFSVSFSLEGSPMRLYDTVGDGLAADTTNNAGIIEFRLANGAEKELRIPWGAVIQISENEYAQFSTTVTSEEGVADLDDEKDRVYKCTVEKDDTITFTNKNVRLTVTKEVTGGFGELTRPFSFTLSGLTAGKLYRLNVAGTAINRTADSEGAITFQLMHEQTMFIALPEGGTYTITEAEEYGYITSLTVNGADSEEINRRIVILNEDTTVAFTNYRPPVAPTGYHADKLPFLVLLLAGAILALVSRRRKGGGAND